ncbi:MAG TPA: hypothetical protein VK447_10240 [Myxococcaceae bacterium]|nr:hypothetical protein [Myxococcaceae bacterium]
MQSAGVAVSVSAGLPVTLPSHSIQVDGGVALPVAFSGLRKVLSALQQVAPATVSRAVARHPSEWNRLFPGSVAEAPDLSDLALSPSERRLHRESEQTFWILNLAAKVILAVLRDTGLSLVIHEAGASDLVSLRGVMRAIEWSRIEGLSGQIVLTGWDGRQRHASSLFEARRRAYLETLRQRMRAEVTEGHGGSRVVHLPEAPVDLEGRYLTEVVDEGLSAERRIAAAILAIRACFFTTNYEGAMLAAEHGLALLDKVGTALDEAAVGRAWDELDNTGYVTPAIEVDRSSLGNVEVLRALFYRQIGVVHVYTGEHQPALDAFEAGLSRELPPGRRCQLRMFRALTMIKRLGNLDRARDEIEDGLAAVAGRQDEDTALHEGWIRNVYALVHFQGKRLDAALTQEKLAIKCVGGLHTPSATHLKINLITNVSVLQETAKQLAEATATWRRFEKTSESWGPNFLKHFSYRLASLQLQGGQRKDALESLATAYASAEGLGDPFHQQAIASELGRLHLDDDNRDAARIWYARAVEAARTIGDPFRLAESLAGLTLAEGGTDFSEARRCASETTTYPKEAGKLIGALDSGEAHAIRAALPGPRNKLNRPFDLVNL